MRYPIAIEIGTETSTYGVVVLDLPGCYSVGDTIDDAVTAAEEAASACIDATLDAGGAVAAPASIEALRARPDYAGQAFGVVMVDPAALASSTERVNITLPRRILLRLAAQARAAWESRSGYAACRPCHPGTRTKSFFTRTATLISRNAEGSRNIVYRWTGFHGAFWRHPSLQ
jgi:predicted RNase H-like HicB family nuclease